MNITIRKINILIALLFLMVSSTFGQAAPETSITVPIGGNGWLNKGSKAKIGDAGLTEWSDSKDTLSVYVRPENSGDLNISLKLLAPKGTSKISLAVGNTIITKSVNNPTVAIINFGKIIIKNPGYIKINLYGISRTGNVYAEVSDVILSGDALAKGASYVKNNEGNYYYWGHRGPSVHLNYKLPAVAKNNVEWFYNEVTVPVGQDALGSYFMADGFTGGYFGMQVNSPTERHILFSIWSPFETNDPKSIPDSLKIHMLQKGAGVHAGEFGNEGSGGQSYMNYPWIAGKTYAFLLRAQVDTIAKTTTFTAYFKEADKTAWQLIASFKRPNSGFYLKGLYSFLENFDPEMGNVQRKVFFGNQYVRDTAGNWYPLNDAIFTGDATANINYRKDYSGGVKGDLFYLRNCGFFDDFTPIRTNLTKQVSNKPDPQLP